MTISCCDGCGNDNEQPLQAAQVVDASSLAQTAGERSEDTHCCDDSSCKCDDACLEQLARAICADDAGHMHAHQEDSDVISEGLRGSTTCCSDDDATACPDSAVHHEKTFAEHAHNADGAEEKASTSVHGNVHTMGASCAHGLRRRRAGYINPSTKPADLPKEACGQHRSFARKRYQDTLAAFGCICRAMLAHGLQSCCTNKHVHKGTTTSSRLARSSRSNGAPSTVSNKSRRSVDSCCKEHTCGGTSRDVGECNHSAKSNKAASRVSLQSSCCDDCHDHSSEHGHGGASSSCEKSDAALNEVMVAVVEKGAGIPNEHAVLVIKGMTCTGCENKVIRVLRALPAIHNVRTSLVLNRAEFDYDNTAAELKELVQIIEKRTGFSIETVNAGATRVLRLAVDPTLRDALMATHLPDGVHRLIRADKATVCIEYDPHTIGARQIIQSYAAFSLVLAPELPDPALAAGMKHIRSLALRTVVSALLMIPVLIMAWAPLPSHPHAYAIASLALATVVQTCITGPIYVSAFKSLFFSRLVETDLLIVLSTTTAYVYSVVAFGFEMHGHALAGGQFFETSTLLVTLIILGQLVSACARQRAITVISIRALQQDTATLVHTDGKEEVVDARLLQYGDCVKVAPDEGVITDGVVQAGRSEVDESMMTGESRPVSKVPGSNVIAGTVNGPSALLIEVGRLPGENTISDIATMVDDARFSHAKVQATVDRICGWFVPVVLSIAVVTFLVWLAVGLAVRRQSGGEAAVTALTYAIAVLAICCPCALGLAVPLVILIAGGVAAKLGLVFKAATTIECAREITHVVFDKTGTLTQGRLSVVSGNVYDSPAFDVRSAITELAKSSKHPVARAVAAYLDTAPSSEKAQVSNVEQVTGRGIQGTVSGGILRGGSATWLALAEDPVVVPLLQRGLTTFCVTYEGQLVAAFGLEDALRPESLFVVDSLKKRNIKVSILSGDHRAAVERVATSLGISADFVKAAHMPADKQAYIKSLAGRGEKVLFCGDGTNDAVALAQADVGIHLHTDEGAGFAASTAADVILTHPSLVSILSLLDLSEAVHRRIVINFAWSAVYNLIAILFAAGAFVKARIAPAYAGLGEIVSVLPVVLVALQLKWFKPSV